MSKSSRVAVIACAIALVAIFARGDEWAPTRAFRTFSKSSWRGLPQSSVMALAQSSDGVLWIGTLDGAATFDGRDITPVPDVPGFAFYAFYGDRAGLMASIQYGVPAVAIEPLNR